MAPGQQTERQDDSALMHATKVTTAAHLRIVHGRTERLVYDVPRGGIVLGREDGDGMSIVVDDPRMSRQHARIEYTASGWTFADLGSRNGAFVGGRTCGPHQVVVIADGTVLRIGDTVMVFRTSSVPSTRDADEPAFPGSSPAAAAVRRRMALLAITSGHVLVLGETGTGKERVARALAIPGGPFITQNCAELSRELARSELFGHVKGAFSGATANKPGLVDQAGNGTLFLDEVGELPLDVQGELLRFLEDGSYRAVGGGDLRHSQCRVVAATNIDVDEAVKAKRFRRDLAARLRASNTPIDLPPLRERGEDIAMWTGLFLQEAGDATTHPVWNAGAIECLSLYPWPENLRELRGLVRTIALDAPPRPWSTDLLPPSIRAHRNALRGGASAPRGDVAPRTDPSREQIEEVLARTQGRMRTAANDLGIDRRKLYRLCERFEISYDAHRDADE